MNNNKGELYMCFRNYQRHFIYKIKLDVTTFWTEFPRKKKGTFWTQSSQNPVPYPIPAIKFCQLIILN